MRKVALRLIPFLAVAYFLNYIDRSNIGVAKLTMSQDIGLTETTFGIASAIFFIGYVFCEVPSNLALYRFGARRWIARIMVSWGGRRRRHGLHPGCHRPLYRSLPAWHRRSRLLPGGDPIPHMVVPSCDAGPAHRPVHARPADFAGNRQPALGRCAAVPQRHLRTHRLAGAFHRPGRAHNCDGRGRLVLPHRSPQPGEMAHSRGA